MAKGWLIASSGAFWILCFLSWDHTVIALVYKPADNYIYRLSNQCWTMLVIPENIGRSLMNKIHNKINMIVSVWLPLSMWSTLHFRRFLLVLWPYWQEKAISAVKTYPKGKHQKTKISHSRATITLDSPPTMMIRWASRVRAKKYTTRSLLGSLRFLKAGVCRVIVWGEGLGGGGTSRGRRGPGLDGGSPASDGKRRFKSASCGEI